MYKLDQSEVDVLWVILTQKTFSCQKLPFLVAQATKMSIFVTIFTLMLTSWASASLHNWSIFLDLCVLDNYHISCVLVALFLFVIIIILLVVILPRLERFLLDLAGW